MSEQQQETVTQTSVVESDEEFIQVERPVMMHRSGKPVVIGSAVITRYKDRVELAAKLETEDGVEFGSLLTAEYVEAMTVGGVLKPELVKRIS